MNTAKNENSESETISASQAALLDSGAKQEGGVTAWCTVAGGYVIILHIPALLALMTSVKVDGTFRDLRIHIIVRSIPGSVRSGWDCVLFQCQLDWLDAALVFRCHGSSCRGLA
jgi:uncharacterized membrane protein